MSTLQAVVSACYNFNEGVQDAKCTVVIAPISIRSSGYQMIVTWGCSRREYCLTASCLYSNRGRSSRNEGH